MDIDETDSSAPPPRYALYSEDSDATIVVASKVRGLFGPRQSDDTVVNMQMLGVRPGYKPIWDKLTTKPYMHRIGNAELVILDDAGVGIGSYPIADTTVEIRDAAPSQSPRSMSVEVSGWMWTRPHPQSEDLWELRSSGGLSKPGGWVELSEDERVAWLEVARISASTRIANGKAPQDRIGGSFVIAGNSIDNQAGFYCAIGEAINGPGGYFGFNLDSLADCLRGGFGALPPFTIHVRGGGLVRLETEFVNSLTRLLESSRVEFQIS